MVGATRSEQRQVSLDRGCAIGSGPLVNCFINCALDAKQVAYWYT